jgi:adenosylcobinamide-phosphate synthase
VSAAALLLALLLDRRFGEPPAACHPVVWLGALIEGGRRWALRARPLGQLARGAALALTVPSLAAAVAWLWARGCAQLGGVAAAVGTALALKPCFALRALGDAAFVVRDALRAGDLTAARAGLATLCSREAATLDEQQLIAAAIESVAENAVDSIVAPWCYFALAGLPGAACYRAVNTLDAMIGYRGRYEWVGKVSARCDDLLNLVPARLTAALLLAVAPWCGGDARRGLAMWRRDGRRTASPNAGRPMAAMAGALGVRLGKPGHYDLGDAVRQLTVDDITRAWRMVSAASWLAAALAMCGAVLLAGAP